MTKMKLVQSITQSINQYRNHLKNLYPQEIKKMVLFGSVARNEARVDSDVDILLVVKNKKKIEDKIYDLATDIMLNDGPYLSVKLYNEREYKKLNNPITFFMKKVQSEGKDLW